jgi:hypothetical protein
LRLGRSVTREHGPSQIGVGSQTFSESALKSIIALYAPSMLPTSTSPCPRSA